MGETVLSNAELGVDGIPGLNGKVPLWFYILKESELNAGGKHLGRVGGRIVAETLLALIEFVRKDLLPTSEVTWTPTMPNRSGELGAFTMADLV